MPLPPVYEADRHAKTQLKKHLRGGRPLERALEEHQTPENEAIRGYCQAVRAALTDDGRSALQASGLKLYDRVTVWPPLQSAYKLVHQAAKILANLQQHSGIQVRECYLAHIRQMQEQKADVGPLEHRSSSQAASV